MGSVLTKLPTSHWAAGPQAAEPYCEEMEYTMAGGCVQVPLTSATEGVTASYKNYHPKSWLSAVGCPARSTNWVVNTLLSPKSIFGGTRCFISLSK